MAEMNALQDLFVDELRDVYDAEKQIVKALPRVIRAASSEVLRNALEEHLDVTRAQVDRLEQVFENLELKPRGKHCPGMEGILEEGKELISEGAKGDVLDAGLIAAAQRVEHYEISVYGTLAAWARQLGHDDVVDLLEETLREEKEADKKLTALAERDTNLAASGTAPGSRPSSSRSRH
jgi:ferritin-like metal-binding protein YciE